MSVRWYVRPYVCPQKVCPISMKFGVYIEVDEWCMTVCCMTRFKVKVKVTSNCKPLKRSRPSVPHQAEFFFCWPLHLTPSTSKSVHFFTHSFSFFLKTRPYHLNLCLCTTVIMSPIPSLCLNSLHMKLLPNHSHLSQCHIYILLCCQLQRWQQLQLIGCITVLCT